MSNQAAWILEPKGNPLVVKEAPMPKAGKGEIVIKNHAVAVNPVDCKCCRKQIKSTNLHCIGKIQDYGMFCTHMLTHVANSHDQVSFYRSIPIFAEPTLPVRFTMSARA